MRGVGAFIAVTALAFASSTVEASGPPAPDPGSWVLMPGGTGGATLPPQGGSAGTFGGEISLSCWRCSELTWVGGYVDLLRDLGRDQYRVSFGPELGSGVAGIDGGPVIAADSGRVRAGLVVRGVLAFGLLGLYARIGQLFVGGTQTYAELGGYFKIPIVVGRHSSWKPVARPGGPGAPGQHLPMHGRAADHRTRPW